MTAKRPVPDTDTEDHPTIPMELGSIPRKTDFYTCARCVTKRQCRKYWGCALAAGLITERILDVNAPALAERKARDRRNKFGIRSGPFVPEQ